jgi:hypothetical protein
VLLTKTALGFIKLAESFLTAFKAGIIFKAFGKTAKNWPKINLHFKISSFKPQLILVFLILEDGQVLVYLCKVY